MGTVRLNISIPENLFRELNKEVKSRQRSRFISNAVRESLKNKREQTLAEEYREAAKDIRKINQELEGALSDGLD
jgi:metal-responsive CopG/Arc/MetJ family transcriptional regulator